MLFVLLLAQSCRHILTLNQFGGHTADEGKCLKNPLKLHWFIWVSELDENKKSQRLEINIHFISWLAYINNNVFDENTY